MKEQVILVNENNEPQGLMEKLEAHQQGVLHRAFSVVVVTEKNGQLHYLLQQRNLKKYHCGGLWSNTCCSHPRVGESVVKAAGRRLKEEMGFKTPLKEIGEFIYKADLDSGLVEHEYDHVLLGYYQYNLPIHYNSSEVQNYRWMSYKEIQTSLKQEKQLFTPWFERVLSFAAEACKDII